MPDVGEVRYKAKVDTSDVESDVKKAEDKIGKSGKKQAANSRRGSKQGLTRQRHRMKKSRML